MTIRTGPPISTAAAALLLLLSPVHAQAVFRVPVTGAARTLDPHAVFDPFHAKYMAQLFETPLEAIQTPQGQLEVAAGACEVPTISADGLLVTLKVRPGGKFSDDACFPGGKGREVTANDVVFSLLRHVDPATGSPTWPLFLQGRFTGVDAWREQIAKLHKVDYDAPPEGIRARGADVELRLTEPYPQLRALLSQSWCAIVPREAVNTYGSGIGSHPVGSGPFRLADVDPVRYRFVKNPGFRIAGRPLVDEVRFDIVPTAEAQAARYLAGDLDAIEIVTPIEKQFLDAKLDLLTALRLKGHRVVDGVPLTVSYLVINVASPVLGKRDVREALTRALDREAIARTNFGARGLRADQILPTVFPETSLILGEPWPAGTRDVGKAKAALAAGGYPDATKFPELLLDITPETPDARTKACVDLMCAQWREAGIRVTPRYGGFDALMSRTQTGDFHIAWVSWFADYPDAENFLALFRSNHAGTSTWGNNYGHYEHPKVDENYLAASRELPGKKRLQEVTDLLVQVRKDCPVIPISYIRPTLVTARGVEGYVPNLLNPSLRDVVRKPSSAK